MALARGVSQAWNERGGELIERAAWAEMTALKVVWETIALQQVAQLGQTVGSALSKACFVAGTEVWTAEGLVPIEQVHAGQLVLSRDEATGELGWKVVVRVFVTPGQEVLALRLADAERGEHEEVEATAEHPFQLEGRGWVGAGELVPGQRVLRADGRWLRVEGVEARGGAQTVYNLEVDDFHTYVVGQFGAWVHNTCNPIKLFRGVTKGHPGHPNALQGKAFPRGGHADPEAHNYGDTESVFTSWTKDRSVAHHFATRGGNEGVVLEKEFSRSQLVSSPDMAHEAEVLVSGSVEGATVHHVLPLPLREQIALIFRAPPMEENQILTLLESISSGPFAEPATMLASAIRAKDARIVISPRFVPAKELHEIYSARRVLTSQRKVPAIGLSDLVDFLAQKHDSSFRIIGITTSSHGSGALFLSQTGHCYGCFVIMS